VGYWNEPILPKPTISSAALLYALIRLEWFEFSDMIHFFAPEIEPVYIFPQDLSNYQAEIESQVSRLA
jgi:hypothetical protein